MRTMSWKPHLNNCESPCKQGFRDAFARTCIVRGIALLIALQVVNKSEWCPTVMLVRTSLQSMYYVEIVITHSVRSGPKPMHYEIYAL